MAHYAELDALNNVIRVIVIDNVNEPTEEEGIKYCQNLLGGIWKKTSYNATIRKNFAGPGYRYDPLRDAFIPPKPFPSWQFLEETCNWKPPVPYPTDGKTYIWDEFGQTWIRQPGAE